MKKFNYAWTQQQFFDAVVETLEEFEKTLSGEINALREYITYVEKFVRDKEQGK